MSLDNVDPLTVERLLEYLYLGQTTVKRERRLQMENLNAMLGLELKLEEEDEDSDEQEEEVPKQSPRKGREPGECRVCLILKYVRTILFPRDDSILLTNNNTYC